VQNVSLKLYRFKYLQIDEPLLEFEYSIYKFIRIPQRYLNTYGFSHFFMFLHHDNLNIELRYATVLLNE